MTQATDVASPALAGSQPDSVVGFGITEIGFLLSGAGENSKRAYELLRLDPAYFTETVVGYGLSSLVAHGMADVSGEADVVLAGPARLLAYAVGQATRWTSIAFLADDGSDVAMYLQGPDAAVLLQPRVAGTWYALFRRPDGRDAEVIKLTLDASTSLAPGSSVYLSSVTADSDTNFLVHKVSDSEWKYSTAPAGPEGAEDAGVNDVDTSGLLAALDTLLALPSASGPAGSR